jgi:hypothetical protein
MFLNLNLNFFWLNNWHRLSGLQFRLVVSSALLIEAELGFSRLDDILD